MKRKIADNLIEALMLSTFESLTISQRNRLKFCLCQIAIDLIADDFNTEVTE